MMTEISLNVLDVLENSARAGASLVSISMTADTVCDKLTVVITDDGCGMTAEQVAHVTDPSFATRVTRKVGLRIPSFKYAAKDTGGGFHIESEPGKGTTVTAAFGLSHIDGMPFGDMNTTVHNLVAYYPDTDFVHTYTYDGASLILGTQEIREVLGGVSLDSPEISAYIMGFLRES